MAGTPLRVISRTPTDSHARPGDETAAAARRLRSHPGTRTRRNHGVFLLSGELLCVYSTRRRHGDAGVSVAIGNGPFNLVGDLSPTQARNLAQALLTAAAAADVAMKGVSHG